MGYAEFGGPITTINPGDYNIVDLVIPYPNILTFLLNDGDLDNNINIYNSPLRNIHVELSLMGIAGIKTFEIFNIGNTKEMSVLQFAKLFSRASNKIYK
jgi:hypothetical protein